MHLPAFWAAEAAAMVAVAGATAVIMTVAVVVVAMVAAMAATAVITPVAAVAVAMVAAMVALARAVATRPLRPMPPLPLRLLPPPLRPLLRLRHPPSNFGVDVNTASNRQCLPCWCWPAEFKLTASRTSRSGFFARPGRNPASPRGLRLLADVLSLVKAAPPLARSPSLAPAHVLPQISPTGTRLAIGSDS